MGSRLYVGNLSYSTTDASLRAAFEPFGQVTSASVMIDRMSSRSRGFGFVEFSSDAEAKQAIEGLHGSELDGRQLTVNEARAREEGGARGGGARPPRGGGFSGGGGRSWDSAPREQSSFGGGGYSSGGGYAGGGGGGGGGRGESEGGGRGKGGGRRNDRGRDRRRQDDNDW